MLDLCLVGVSKMRILCINQSSELYGSDRSFLLCVNVLREKYPEADIDVLLPEEGPLSRRLAEDGFNVVIREIYKLKKSDIKYGLLNKIMPALMCLPDRIKFIKKYDVVYINTVVVLDYILATRFFPGAKIVHVREIPSSAGRPIFKAPLSFGRVDLIFNSEATKKFFNFGDATKQHVVLNGIGGYKNINGIPFESNKIKILLIGRISAWKGQDLLIEAVAGLPVDIKNKIAVRIVGSAAPGNELMEQSMCDKIKNMGLGDVVEWIPFSRDPEIHYDWADVVVVPSTKPEPFGLVAIEGMSAGRLVAVADHGGLAEIVIQDFDGIKFEPANCVALTNAIKRIVIDRDKMKKIANQGKNTFHEKFSDGVFRHRFIDAFEQAIKRLN